MIFASVKSNMELALCINIDGLPLFNSSKYQFWPILASFFGLEIYCICFDLEFCLDIDLNIITYEIPDYPQIRPFVIAIWCGEGRAVLNEYLAEFVSEVNSLSRNGIHINNHKINVYIKAFICDTPARAYVKGCYLKMNFPFYDHLKFVSKQKIP